MTLKVLVQSVYLLVLLHSQGVKTTIEFFSDRNLHAYCLIKSDFSLSHSKDTRCPLVNQSFSRRGQTIAITRTKRYRMWDVDRFLYDDVACSIIHLYWNTWFDNLVVVNITSVGVDTSLQCVITFDAQGRWGQTIPETYDVLKQINYSY